MHRVLDDGKVQVGAIRKKSRSKVDKNSTWASYRNEKSSATV